MNDAPRVHHRESGEPVTLTRAELDALLEVAAERGAMKALQRSAPAAPLEPAIPVAIPAATPARAAEWVPEWCDVKRAQHELKRSRDRAVAAIRRHGLGRRVDGRWRVDLARLRAFLENRPYPPLQSTTSA